MTKLLVRVPTNNRPEREYAVRTVLELLGEWEITLEGDSSLCSVDIHLPGAGNPVLHVTDDLLADWRTDVPSGRNVRRSLALVSIPRQLTSDGSPATCVTWAHRATAPVLSGDPTTGSMTLDVDAFGLAFHILCGIDERHRSRLDEHDRFPASASDLCRLDVIERPVVDELSELLTSCLVELGATRPEPKRRFCVWPTHDVDHPFPFRRAPARWVLARAKKESQDRGRPHLGAAYSRLRTALGGAASDPLNTFGWILDVLEWYELRGAFNFIPDPSQPGRLAHAAYDLNDPDIEALMRSILQRGHEVGFHPSYGAHLDQSRFARELEELRSTVRRLDSDAVVAGGRQHFLRWDAGRSPLVWSEAKLSYDSTVGFAERPGFRVGTSVPHPVFDIRGRRTLSLQERPLILMDSSVLNSKYLGLAPLSEEAVSIVRRLRAACEQHRGVFTFLWHNTVLGTADERALYLECLVGETAVR